MINNKHAKANYTVDIIVQKQPREVFYHLLYNVSAFWPEQIQGQGFNLYDEFIFRTGDSHYSKNKVIELVPNKRLVWLVIDSLRKPDNFVWTGTKMIFELTPQGNNTQIRFTYDGIVLENETDRLSQVCDFVIKENLFRLLSREEKPLNGETKSCSVTIEVEKSVANVFNCLKDVSQWWSRDFEGSSLTLYDEFVICHPGRHYSKQKLVEVIPDNKLVWLVTESTLNWLEKDKQEWTGTKMIFELTSAGNKTQLHFTHEGLVPAKECYSLCEKGWNMVIRERLFNYINRI
jgi:activator of Hsp90 ATPase-like protein